jgi:DNA invertase Pin-like site-specific DNA recombinase
MPTSKNTARKCAAGGSSDNSCGVEPLRAVIYARYSSSGQREESIEGQLRDCYEFAKKHGIIVIGEYIDKAMTGRVDRRPDFQRMMKDSEKGRFNCVLLWKMDRFARNRYDSAMYKYKLKKNGIRIFYAKETIPDGPEGIILESVMEGYAEYYSENLAQNVKRGNYDSALELKTLGKTCLGLKTGPDGRYMIDQAEAVIVRRIFEEYAAGERAKDIYERLNSEGYRTSRGGKFNKNSLRRILSNKKYIGVYEYEDIYVENGIPAIITDRDLFERVQKMLKINHDAPARGKAQNFLLTTKLFCGLCGSPMIGDGGTSHTGKAYAYYSCTKRKRGRSCKKESVPKDWIEDLVVGELVKIVHNDELIEQIADRVMEYQKREKDQSGLHALETRQKENEKAISNMLAAIEAGIITPSTKTRLMELEADRADIEKGIAHELLAEPEFERDQIIYFLERFRSGDINDEAYRIMLVDTFLNSVYLYDDDHLVLVMNYSGENCKVDLKLVEGAVSGDGCKGSAFAPSSALNGAKPNPVYFFKKVFAVVVNFTRK